MDLEVLNLPDVYGKGDTSARIAEILKDTLNKDMDMKKIFYDLSQSNN